MTTHWKSTAELLKIVGRCQEMLCYVRGVLTFTENHRVVVRVFVTRWRMLAYIRIGINNMCCIIHLLVPFSPSQKEMKDIC